MQFALEIFIGFTFADGWNGDKLVDELYWQPASKTAVQPVGLHQSKQ